MTEELEETISQLKGKVLDQQELLVSKDRAILKLEDENKRLKRKLRELEASGKSPKSDESRYEPSTMPPVGTSVEELAAVSQVQKPFDPEKLPPVKESSQTQSKGLTIASKRFDSGEGSASVASSKFDPSTMPAVGASDTHKKAFDPSTMPPMEPPRSVTSVSSVRKYSPYQKTDPLMEFDDIPGMDNDEGYLDELLDMGSSDTRLESSGKRENSILPQSSMSVASFGTSSPVRTSTPPPSAVQVMGTPEKTRQKNLEIMNAVRQREQEQEARKEHERQNLVIKPVATVVKAEQDHGAFGRSVIERSKSKLQDKDRELQKKLAKSRDDKATEVAEKRREKSSRDSLFQKFIDQGREQVSQRVVTTRREEDNDDYDTYEIDNNTMTRVVEDPSVLRREAESQNKDLDETSNFFLRERFLSPAEITTMTEDTVLYSVTDCLRALRGGTEMQEPSFAVCGVVSHGPQVKMHNFGGTTKKTLSLRLSDRATLKEEWSVALTCHDDALDLCLHWRVGSVVIIVNPVVRKFHHTDKKSGAQSEEQAFSISSGNNNLAFEVGITSDVGRCESNTRTGERCKRVIYRRKMDMCHQHHEIRVRERKKKEGGSKRGESKIKNIDGSAPLPVTSRAEFNSAPSLVQGSVVTSVKPHGKMMKRDFKRPSQHELIRQKKENDRVMDEIIKKNPKVAEVFGKQDETRQSLPKHMSHHRHPDDVKVSRFQDDKRMSDYVMEKPDRKKWKPMMSSREERELAGKKTSSFSSTSSREGTPIPTEPAAMRKAKDAKALVAEASRKQVLLARNHSLADDDSDDGLDIV